MQTDHSSGDGEDPALSSNAVDLPIAGEVDLKQSVPPPGSELPLPEVEGESCGPESFECVQQTDENRIDIDDIAVRADEVPEPSEKEELKNEASCDVENFVNKGSSAGSSSEADICPSNDVSELSPEASGSQVINATSCSQNLAKEDPSNLQTSTSDTSLVDESRDAVAFIVEDCLQKVFDQKGLLSESLATATATSAEINALAPPDQSDQGSVDMDVDPSPESTIATAVHSGADTVPSSDIHSKGMSSEKRSGSHSRAVPAVIPVAKSTESTDARMPSPASKKKGNETKPPAGRRRSPPRARSPFRRVRRSPFRGPRSPPRVRRSPPRRRSPLRFRSLSPRRRDRALEPGDATCQIICLGTAQSRYTAYCMDQIRGVGISCSMRYLDQQSLSAVMGAVVHSRARYVIIIGKENELKGTVNFKVLSDKERKSVATTIENAITIMVDHERPFLERERLPRSPYPLDYSTREPRSMRRDDYDNYSPRYPEPDRYAPEPDRYAPEPDRYAPDPDRYALDRYAYERDPYAYPASIPSAAPSVPTYGSSGRNYSPSREAYSRYLPPPSAVTYSPPRDLGNLQHSRYQPMLPAQTDGYSRYPSQTYGGYDPRSTPTPAASSSTYDPYTAVSPRMPPSRLGGASASYAGPPPRAQYDQPYDYPY